MTLAAPCYTTTARVPDLAAECHFGQARLASGTLRSFAKRAIAARASRQSNVDGFLGRGTISASHCAA
jgi:hypothetical protein